MPKITIHNVETNEIIEREMNADELADYEANNAAYEQREANRLAAEAKRIAALAKLEALGLDEDDLKALGL